MQLIRQHGLLKLANDRTRRETATLVEVTGNMLDLGSVSLENEDGGSLGDAANDGGNLDAYKWRISWGTLSFIYPSFVFSKNIDSAWTCDLL